jgi:hypothetical protein
MLVARLPSCCLRGPAHVRGLASGRWLTVKCWSPITQSRGPRAGGDTDRRAWANSPAAGLTGILVAPGPGLVYLAGYAPVAVTERLTLLILQKQREPAMILPILERPDAERAPSAGTIALTDWADGSDPYAAAAPLLDLAGTYAISDSAWALQLLGLQQALPGTRFVSMSTALPMLRAVKDAHELERLAEAGGAADACFEEILKVRFAGRKETEVAADVAAMLIDHGHCHVLVMKGSPVRIWASAWLYSAVDKFGRRPSGRIRPVARLTSRTIWRADPIVDSCSSPCCFLA